MKSFRVVVLFCTLMAALAAFAHQGSMQQPAPQTPGAASQNPQAQNPQVQNPPAQSPQTPGATPPDTPSQTQSGTAPSPATQTPQGESSQPPAMHSSSSGADAQVNALTGALNLNSDQQTKIKAILEDQHQQAVSVVNDPSTSRDAKLQKIHALRQQTIDKVRGTLTSDEQKSKFDTMIQSQNERIHEREQQEQQPNNTPAPK